MSYVPTQGNEILVGPSGDERASGSLMPGHGLTTWLVGKFDPWERHREQGYGALWRQYWRMWRGQWAPEDRNRQSERSRLIAPALAQAVEMTVAEVEEGLLSKETWFAIADDYADEEKGDVEVLRRRLQYDLDDVNARDAVSEATLNGAIFGTGIIKLNVEVRQETRPVRSGETRTLTPSGEEVVRVVWESIRPDEFVPDPAGRNIQEMLGFFHKVKKPLHYVQERIEKGIYRADAAPWVTSVATDAKFADIDPNDPQSSRSADEGDEVEIIEYHGKVPVSLLNAASSQKVGRDEEGNVTLMEQGDNPIDQILNASAEDEMVEAIVTIANKGVLLRAKVNPFVMKDRSIVAFQFEKVPGRFWGRGVCEKGFNPQKALDAEMRARIDALGFISSPMLGIDGGRIPRGHKLDVKPGKIFLTQGPPREILQPVEIGALQPNTFNQTQELERMVQMGTGAFDTASALGRGSDSNGPQAASLMMGAFVKRAKRSIRNVNDNLLQPLLKQSLWRFMQFAPRRYPTDFEFKVQANMGIVAKEVEAMQLTQLMGMLPDQFPGVATAVAKGIIDLSSVHNKAEIQAQMDAAMQPPSEEEQQRAQALEEAQFTAVRAEAQGKLLANQKTLAEIRKLLAEVEDMIQSGDQDEEKLNIEKGRLLAELEQLEILHEQNQIALKRLDLMEKQLDAKLRERNG